MSLLSPQLEAFLAVVNCKTVHAAAAKIHLTQTAVTQRIRTLEKQLKTTLFIRTRRGMLLTPEGEALLRYCHITKESEGEALAIIQGAGKHSEVSINITAPTSIMHARVIPNCLATLKKFSNLLVHFITDDVEHRHQMLKAGQVDFAIINEQQLTPEMKYKKLQPEEYVLVGSYAWKGRKLNDILQNERIIDFDSSDQLTFDYLKQYNLPLPLKNNRYYVNRTDNLALLVSEGIGYTTLAKEFAAPYIKDHALIVLNKGLAHNVHPVLAWFDRPEPPDYFSAIIDGID